MLISKKEIVCSHRALERKVYRIVPVDTTLKIPRAAGYTKNFFD